MSQRRKDKRNEFKNYKSYPSYLDYSLKDDSPVRIRSASYSSGDEEIRPRIRRNYHSSRKSHVGKSLKSPLVVRKDSDSNDSGSRRHSDSANRHKTRDHQDHKETRREKHHCRKSFLHEKNKRGSESFREKHCGILEDDGHFRRFSSTEVNQFSPKRSSTYNLWNDDTGRNRIKNEERKKYRGLEFFELDHKDDSIYSPGSKEKRKEIEESNLEGSARTRGFYFRKKEERHQIRDKNNSDSTDDYFQKKARTQKLIRRRRSKSESAESKNPSRKASVSRSRKVENSTAQCLELKTKTSFHSFDCKSLKIKKAEEIKRQEIKISSENVSMNKNVSSPVTERSSKSNKTPESSKKSFKHKKLKIDEENKKCDVVSSESENHEKNECIRKNQDSEEGTLIFSNDLNMKFNEDPEKKEIQEAKKKKIKNQTRKYKNRSNYKKSTLRCLLMYVIRKIILSEHKENKNDDKDEKIKTSEDDSCINIKQENGIESSCESSGYDSMKNIQEISEINKDQISQFIKNQSSEAIFSLNKSEGPFFNFSNYLESKNLKESCNDMEFLNFENYCVYKVYKISDGEILLKESHSPEFKRGEYVIGKRILKEPERFQQFSKKKDPGVPDKNSNQFSLRNNSTQTELNILASKQSWFRKSYTEGPWKMKKHLTSLESTSNSSFPESSDFEQFNLPFRKNQNIYSPTSKNSLANLPKSPAHFLKKSSEVDTSDLSYFTTAKSPENKMVFLFNSSQNENNFRSSASPPSIIPVSWLKLDNSELFIAQKTNIKEIFRVQMENNSNILQSTECQIKKSELIYSDQNPTLRRKKKFRKFFRIFKGKKKYDRINSEEEKLKVSKHS